VNKGTLGGICIALLGIALGLYLDGGKLGQVLQPTAALIVFGGTLGAVMVQFPTSAVIQATKQLRSVFVQEEDTASHLIGNLSRYATMARRNGLASLDAELESISDPFLRKALTLAVDGVRPSDLRSAMELQMDQEVENDDLIPRVFECAGGYAPTIGILGAVIGLIQVMERLANINEVGKGIAVAFVATIYGVGSANILFLPIAGRIKILMRRNQVLRELIVNGVILIVEKTNPRIVESRLSVYLNGAQMENKKSVAT
jgi:chemotaxis protein MotA